MIKLVYAADLFRRPVLAASMFRDRGHQFRERLNWDVAVDPWGCEFDEYDDLNPVYVIVENDAGEHLGSARLLPTTGRTMLNEHFPDLAGGAEIRSPLIWETTRFCISPKLTGNGRMAVRTPAQIMYAGCELALRCGVEFYVGVFNAQMLRVYKSTGWTPEVLGSRVTEQGEICAGLWEVTPEMRDHLAKRGRIDEKPLEAEFFPTEERFPAAEPLTPGKAFAAMSEIAHIF